MLTGLEPGVIQPLAVGFLINALTKTFDVSGEAFHFFDDSVEYIGWYGKEQSPPIA